MCARGGVGGGKGESHDKACESLALNDGEVEGRVFGMRGVDVGGGKLQQVLPPLPAIPRMSAKATRL